MEQQRKVADNCVVNAEDATPHVHDKERGPSNLELLKRLRKYRGRMPEGFKFDRVEAHERG